MGSVVPLRVMVTMYGGVSDVSALWRLSKLPLLPTFAVTVTLVLLASTTVTDAFELSALPVASS